MSNGAAAATSTGHIIDLVATDAEKLESVGDTLYHVTVVEIPMLCVAIIMFMVSKISLILRRSQSFAENILHLSECLVPSLLAWIFAEWHCSDLHLLPDRACCIHYHWLCDSHANFPIRAWYNHSPLQVYLFMSLFMTYTNYLPGKRVHFDVKYL